MKNCTVVGSAPHVIVIGGSAGGVRVLIGLLRHLPAIFVPSIVVVVHVRTDGHPTLAEHLTGELGREVREPEDKEPILGWHVYAASAGYHLLLGDDHRFSLGDDEPVRFARPSIDVLFASAAEAYGACATGVILTGANDDGAAGLAALARAGGRAIVQDPREADHDVMPRFALRACPQAEILEGSKIAAWLASGDQLR